MMKLLKIFLLSIFTFVLSATQVSSVGEFTTDSSVTYNVQENGITKVTHNIKLNNNFSSLYATSYTLTLDSIDALNTKAYGADSREFKLTQTKDGNTTYIKVEFPDVVAGQGKLRDFNVSYDNPNFAVRTGEVWEISIPKLSDENSYRNYDVNILIPKSFGLEAYISPVAESKSENDRQLIYTFSKEELVNTAITAGFGEFQVFTYTLNYHLENPLAISSQTEIALPPDNAYQKVYINSIIPEPSHVEIDENGNWIAKYKLSPRQRIDIVVNGEVQIFSSFRHFPKPTKETLQKNLLPKQYWESDNLKIQDLAKTYKTPRDIYNFVTTHLKYDYSRVNPNVERLGALKILDTPDVAICMEFTDLFIAIARAAGIPAREVNGYAYTENPQIQPLSLVADVLHSWPEYYDNEKGVWIPIDPTWGSTSGVNYFDKLDLRHFAFVIHGDSSDKPYPPGSYKLGANPQKDVFVSFGKLSQNRTSFPEIKAKYTTGLFFLNSKAKVDITNPGPSAMYDLYPEVYFDSKKKSSVFIEALPPFGKYSFTVDVPFSFLGQKTPVEVKIDVDGSRYNLTTNKNKIIITSLIILFTLLFLLVIGILLQQKRFNLSKIWKLSRKNSQ